VLFTYKSLILSTKNVWAKNTQSWTDKNMLKEYQISNFKAFAGPESVPIKPITLIFGPNSSGKSSILQSLLMLKQTIADNQNTLTPLLFKGDLVDLGSYREFIHRHEAARSFSFKVEMPMPESLDAPFDYPYIVGAYGQGGLSDLEKSLKGFQTVGMGIYFSHSNDKLGTDIIKIELFLGKDPMPVITYEGMTVSSGSQVRVCSLEGGGLNENHGYWKSHWKTFDETDDTHVRAVIENVTEDPIALILYRLEKQSPEEWRFSLQKLHNQHFVSKAEETHHNVKFSEVEEVFDALLRINDDSTASYDDLGISNRLQSKIIPLLAFGVKEAKKVVAAKDKLQKLSGFELALEAYKIRSAGDTLALRGFLPETLNGWDMSDIIPIPDNFSRNLSVLALTVARLFRRVLEEILYIGPLRNFPERYFMYSGVSSAYVGKSGNFVPDILVSDTELLTKVNEQLERFDLGYELKLSSLSDETTAVQDLFALRLYDKSTGIHVGTTDVGFGFSQVLPVIAQCLISQQNMILIEQPELHLHPRLQAELGDLFIDSALGDSENTLIIETHSEHLILRLLRRIRETAEGELKEGQIPITPDDLSVVYAKPTDEGTKLVHLRVTEDGDFADPWPDGFFSERSRELF